jgi:hypothetical protein
MVKRGYNTFVMGFDFLYFCLISVLFAWNCVELVDECHVKHN